MFILAVLVSLPWFGYAAEWGYSGHNGPDYWGANFSACDGQSQSPINIDLSDLMYEPMLTEITLVGYSSPASVGLKLKNNGHSLVVDMLGNLMVHGGALPGFYRSAQFHFHWGSNVNQGSEHTIDGRRFPMEMHIVSYNVMHMDIATAINKPKGLAVLGFFFEVGPEDNPNFAPIINYARSIYTSGTDVDIPSFAVDSLLPEELTHYYRYDGSLTTPGCHESVVWTVFNSTIKISEIQLQEFRRLEGSAHGEKIQDNYRPTQPLNGRYVYSSNPKDASSAVTVSMRCLTSLVLVIFGSILCS